MREWEKNSFTDKLCKGFCQIGYLCWGWRERNQRCVIHLHASFFAFCCSSAVHAVLQHRHSNLWKTKTWYVTWQRWESKVTQRLKQSKISRLCHCVVKLWWIWKVAFIQLFFKLRCRGYWFNTSTFTKPINMCFTQRTLCCAWGRSHRRPFPKAEVMCPLMSTSQPGSEHCQRP